MRPICLAGILLLWSFAGNASEGPEAEARRWIAAKFLDRAEAAPAAPHLIVRTKSAVIYKDRIRGRKFRIAGQDFERGIAMPSPGEVEVHLPAPAASFEAVLGVDSNDLGYYSNAGRGNVVASVEAGGQELFRSAVMHEGMPGIPIKLDLAGAAGFRLKLTAAGERTRTYQAEWDQADWADARVTMMDGSTVWLAALPMGPLPGPYSTDPPFSFRYAGRASGELLGSWPAKRITRHIDEHRTEYVTTYTDSDTGLEVRTVAIAYDDFPTVEWTVYLRNVGAAPTPIIEDLQAIDTRLERTAEREFVLHYSKGSPNSPTDYEPLESLLGPNESKQIATTGGRPTDSHLCYFNVDRGGPSAIIALGWPGQWSAQFTRDDGNGLRVRAGQELTHFRLLAGEEVRTPLVALEFSAGDWIAAQNVWRRWMVAHNLPRPGGKLPPPQVASGSNRYTIEMQDANEENQMRFLKRDLDSGLPIDYWWMDAGWYPFQTGWWNTGTWEPDPRRFPRGLAPVTAEAHAHGLKTILWFEPERVAPGSWLYLNHPEWLLGREGKDKLFYLGNPEARQWLADRVSRLIREQGIDLYRQDFNFEPLAIWRANDASDRQGITEIKHVVGYLAYWDELRRRFPAMLIDTCASGGRRNDLETLRRAVPLWRSDFAYEPAAMQQMTYGMALWIPYFGTALNAVEPYIFRSQMTPAVGIGLDPARSEDGYRKLGGLLAQWRGIADYYYGDYYPLTGYSTESTAWMAWQFHRPDRSDGIVQAFRRPDSPFESARFRLRGLDPAARYGVVDMDSKRESEFSGRELLESGLPVSIPIAPSAMILTYGPARSR